MAAPPRRRASPPALPEELVEEILLRLPPDDPACLLRASVVCKAWGGAFSHPSFRRRFHELHGTPPVLGFLHDWNNERIPNFVSTTASAFSLDAPDRRLWRALDCRHGRAVFVSQYSESRDTTELLVWELITGAQQRVPVPAAFQSMYAAVQMYPSAAVFCAADGCDHHGCHGGPFSVVFVFTVQKHRDYEDAVTSACVYSSETGTWGDLTSMDLDFMMDFGDFPCLLVGRSLVYSMSNGMGAILEYDYARNELAAFNTPDCADRFILMLAADGGLRLIQDFDSCLKLWSREASGCTGPEWVLSRVIDLGNLLPIDALVNATTSLSVLGFAEGANVIFVTTPAGLFTIELLSERVRKVYGKNGFYKLIPVVGFYTPLPRNGHQDLTLLNAGLEERGEEEKTVDQAPQLFDNGLNAIKEGTSSRPSNVPAMSSYLDERITLYGDVAP